MAADRAAEPVREFGCFTPDLNAMADVGDVPQEKLRIQKQVESIRRRLEAIAGDES